MVARVDSLRASERTSLVTLPGSRRTPSIRETSELQTPST